MAIESVQPSERARALSSGGYDLHTHIGPDVMKRRIEDIDLARRFAEVGLAGFALKSHYTSTAERATVVGRVVPGVRVIGTLTLNARRRRHERARGRDRGPRGRAHRVDADGRLTGGDCRPGRACAGRSTCRSGRGSSTSCATPGSRSSRWP